MQKVFIFLIAAFIAYGCATSKKVADVSVGTWDYIVKDTPNGDVEGNFVIVKEGDTYTGSLNGDQGSIPLEDIEVEGENLSYLFDFQGMQLAVKGTIEGSAFTGNVSVDYNDFPMTATKRE